MYQLLALKPNTTISQNGKTTGVFVGHGDEKFEGKLTFTVTKPEIEHEIVIKAVLYDSSTLDLEAVLVVETGAKHSNTYLKLDCLLMSDQATARLIPSLEITEDAVKSGHGATVSSVNQEHLEYLQSRGLSRKEAEKVIVEGFLS